MRRKQQVIVTGLYLKKKCRWSNFQLVLKYPLREREDRMGKNPVDSKISSGWGCFALPIQG